MARERGKANQKNKEPSALENILWAAADKLRGNMDAAEYKHIVLGLIFLKYISDAFEEQHTKLLQEEGADPEDKDEYRAFNVFWVPQEARWTHLQAKAKQPEIGKVLDDAMIAIERENPSLKGVLPKDYARPHLDKQRLGELIDLIANYWVLSQLALCRPWKKATSSRISDPIKPMNGLLVRLAKSMLATLNRSRTAKHNGLPCVARALWSVPETRDI